MPEFIINQNTLDKLCDDFEQMQYKAGAWWPTIEEINSKLIPVINEKIAFAIWIIETANPPQTEDEKESRKLLSRLIYEHLEEEPEESEEKESC